MKLKLLILFLLLIPLASAQFNLTLEMDRTDYLPGEMLEGNLKIQFLETFQSDKLLTIELKNQEDNKTIKALLGNTTYNEIPAIQKSINPEQSKTISFSDNKEKFVSIKLPRNTETIDTFTMDIQGLASDSLSSPKIDIGNDGKIEWYYLGTFKNWNSEFSKSIDLVEANEGEAFINKNMTGYCAEINLPYSKDFQIFAKYQKLGTKGNLKATILSVPSGDPTSGATGGSQVCDLDESTSFDWHSCSMSLNYVPQGDTLICVYSTEGEGSMYKLGVDSGTETITSYTCPIGENQICKLSTSTDFFVKVKGAEYDETIKNTVKLSSWQTSPDAVKEALRYYLGIGYPGLCKTTQCEIPIRITANNTGDLVLKNMKIQYIQDELLKVEKSIYNLDFVKAFIDNINGVNLTELEIAENLSNYTIPSIIIPLNSFSILTPGNLTADGQIVSLRIELGDEVLTQKIIMYNETLPDDIMKKEGVASVLADITELKKQSDLLSLLEIDLTTAEDSIKALEGSTLDSESLDLEIKKIMSGIPKKIVFVGQVVDNYFVQPNDIVSDIPGNERDILLFQENINVKTTIQEYYFSYYDSTSSRIKVVEKDISSFENLKNVDLYEILPGDEVYFERTPGEEIRKNSLFKWTYESFTGAKLKYAIITDKAMGVLDLPTIIIGSVEEEMGCFEDSECLDNEFCNEFGECVLKPESSFPLFWIILISVLILVFGGGYVFWRSTFKKNQFSMLSDFVKQMRTKGMPDTEIKKMLLSKGWKSLQVLIVMLISKIIVIKKNPIKK